MSAQVKFMETAAWLTPFCCLKNCGHHSRPYAGNPAWCDRCGVDDVFGIHCWDWCSFVDRSTHWIWSLLSGLVGILAGLFVLRHPLFAALTVPTVIVIVLGIQGLVMGAFQIIGGFKGGGIGPFILGAINTLVGILLLGSPIAAALAVPIVFGALLLIQGAGLIILAFRVRA